MAPEVVAKAKAEKLLTAVSFGVGPAAGAWTGLGTSMPQPLSGRGSLGGLRGLVLWGGA